MGWGAGTLRGKNGTLSYFFILSNVHLGTIRVNSQLDALSLTCIPDDHLHRVIYTKWCIDTIDSPDDGHCVARNMYRSEINTLKKCVKLVINTNSQLHLSNKTNNKRNRNFNFLN